LVKPLIHYEQSQHGAIAARVSAFGHKADQLEGRGSRQLLTHSGHPAERLPPNFCPNANFFCACKRENHALSRNPTSPALALAVAGTFVGEPKPPNVSFEQRASRELINLIWKLRWIGEDEEAKEAQMQLARI
jgi:hypothetical protein